MTWMWSHRQVLRLPRRSKSAGQATQTDESLRRNVEQLTSIVRVSRELSSMVDQGDLVELILDEAMRTTRAACGAVLLLEADGSSISTAISSSSGCALPDVLSPLDQQVLASEEGQLVSDYSVLDQTSGHDGIASAVVVPIINREKSAGLIQVHSPQAGFFDHSSLDILQTLASQAGAALENIQRYQDQRQRTELLRRRSETLTKITEVSYGLNFDQPLDQLLRTIANSIREATPFQAVLISIYEPDTGLLRTRDRHWFSSGNAGRIDVTQAASRQHSANAQAAVQDQPFLLHPGG